MQLFYWGFQNFDGRLKYPKLYGQYQKHEIDMALEHELLLVFCNKTAVTGHVFLFLLTTCGNPVVLLAFHCNHGLFFYYTIPEVIQIHEKKKRRGFHWNWLHSL